MFTPKMPIGGTINNEPFFLFGDMRRAAVFGDRRQLTLAISEHANFATDELTFRATERVDINVHDVGDASVAGPIVGLIGNT